MTITITCATCHAHVEAADPQSRVEEIALKEGVGPYALPCLCGKAADGVEA